MVHHPAGRDWSVIIAVLSHAINHWTEFDGWAISNGFDPLELSSRRLMAAAWAFLTREMDIDVRETLIENLYAEVSFPTTTTPDSKPKTAPGVITAPKEKWRAPKGWKPPGWNEEQSYKTSMEAMSFNANPK